jgi:hypothetical protein
MNASPHSSGFFGLAGGNITPVEIEKRLILWVNR